MESFLFLVKKINVRPPIRALGFLLSMLLAIFFLIWSVRDKRVIIRFSLFKILRLEIKGEIILRKIDLVFRSCVILISIRVILFRCSYIQEEPNLKYFTIMVMIFVMSINFLIFFPHIIILLLG